MTKDIVPAIKQRLTLPLPGKYMQMQMAPTFRPDINNQQTSVKAGVMILLYPNPTELYVVLMKRPEYPGTHSGQISFPGGKFEANDENLIKTALRETEEEIGVLSSNVMVLGQLTPLYIPASEFEVYPTVGFIDKPQFIIDPQEVEYVIEAEANFLLRPDKKGSNGFQITNTQGDIPYFNINGNHVWGATAMILNEFLEIVKDIQSIDKKV